MDTCVILNPKAGKRRQGGVRKFLERRAEVRATDGPRRGEELARRAAEEGFRQIVAAGGDGTFHEVVNGVLAASADVTCGLVPLGTGNDFARSLNVPRDLEAAWSLVEEGRARRIDAGKMSSGDQARWFVNAAVGGKVDALDERLTEEVKQAWGPLAYFRAAATTVTELEPYRVVLRWDGQPGLEIEAHGLAVTNGRWIAGGTPVAPEAYVDDGELDCIVIRAVEGLDIPALGARILVGAHLGDEPDDRILFQRCRRLEVDSRPPLAYHADGEQVEGDRPRFEAVPGALRMLCGLDPPAVLGSADDQGGG